MHRYPDRVLFKLVHVCAVYCRFCFRREMVGPGKDTALSQRTYAARSTISARTGDLGSDPDRRRSADAVAAAPAEIMRDLAAIAHVKIIRIHTRMPVADPARVTEEMVEALKVKGATTWVALHANHPRELTAARAACARLIDAGIPLVSQSVLLRGVNDDAATLEALMRAFVECRIKPYYLHHGDLAPGTAHLRTTLEEGQALMRALRGRVSGLCQPDYVLDIPGGHGKAPVGPNYLSDANSLSQAREQHPESRYRVVDYCGDVHLYPPKA